MGVTFSTALYHPRSSLNKPSSLIDWLRHDGDQVLLPRRFTRAITNYHIFSIPPGFLSPPLPNPVKRRLILGHLSVLCFILTDPWLWL